ncbi:WD40/YVTN/BNR-like repeat-containing protein [Acidobacteriota bacterium]
MSKQKRNFHKAAIFGLCVIFLFSFLQPIQAQKATKQTFIKKTDPKLRFEWFSEHKQIAENSPFKSENWYHIGPTNVSGRCTDIAVVTPKGKNFTIYVATASGGVWKTVNEGTTWEPIFEHEASASIGDIALAPSNQDIIWVGTGEANIFRSSQNGAGIYKSTDAGKTWKHMGLADTLTIGRIVIHPSNPDIVYVAATGHEWTDNEERGVFKTTDGGQTWTKILYIDEKTGAFDLAIDPTDTETLYTTAWSRVRPKWNDPRVLPGYMKSGVYKTTDGGENWTPINKGLPGDQHRGRIGLDICLSQPNVLYALVDNYEVARELTAEERADAYTRNLTAIIKGATVYRSDDKGESWKQVSGLTETLLQYMMGHSGTFGWVFGQIRVDPNDPDRVYIMGVPLSVSTDGGKTFQRLRGMHGDHHGMWIDPDNSNYIINVNDGGIVISYDKGQTWRQFVNNLPVCQFFNVSFDMDTPFRVYGSMQDHGSFRGIVTRTANGFAAVEWEGAPGGEGSTHAIDPGNPNLVYSAGFYGHITRTDLSKTRQESSKNIFPVEEEGLELLRGQWLAPIILSPSHSDTVYLGLQYLYRSRFQGDIWERISPNMSYNIKEELGDIPYQTIFSISESPQNSNLIYCGTDDGKVHVTKDGGKTWKEIMKGLPYRKWVSRITASRYDQGTVYMTQNGKRDDDFALYIWKSTDFGETWQSITGNIKLGPANVIVEDPINRNILYVGTDVGVYVTKDGGEKWDTLGGNLPTVYVQDLVIHPRENVIVIATHGRGMWALDAKGVNGGRQQRRF